RQECRSRKGRTAAASLRPACGQHRPCSKTKRYRGKRPVCLRGSIQERDSGRPIHEEPIRRAFRSIQEVNVRRLATRGSQGQEEVASTQLSPTRDMPTGEE